VRVNVWLERLAIAVASLALSIGLIALLSGYFAGKDQAGVSGAAAVGQQFRDLGHAPLKRGSHHPSYDSSPPTSGAHVPEPIRHNESRINDDQLLQALEEGNVVIMYGTHRPPAGLVNVARAITGGPFSPALAAAGQAVILARRPGTSGLIGLAWTHLVHVDAPSDDVLQAFAQYWLGRGAPAG
jgi:Protein of unknown function (DUF3105)